MSQQEPSTGDVTPEISDQEVEKYFETQGELPETKEEITEDHQDTEKESAEIIAQPDTNADTTADDSKHDRNYKAAMHEERERRKEAQRQIDDLKSQNEKLRGTFEKVIKSAEEQQRQAQAPSFDDDPIAALKYENEQTKKELASLKQDKEDRASQHESMTKQQQFLNNYRVKTDEFSKENPDFKNAYQHLIDSRYAEHVEAGFTHDQANQMLHEDEAAIVVQAMQQGVNPAERLYKLAKLRGYQNNTNVSNNKDKLIANNQAKIEQLEKGLKASKTINNAGAHSDNAMTLESIAAMDDEEFSKVDWNKVLKLG